MSILNSHFLMHAHHNFTSFVILYICLSKYKPYRAYVTNLIYSTINKVCLSVCLSVCLRNWMFLSASDVCQIPFFTFISLGLAISLSLSVALSLSLSLSLSLI